MIHLRVFQTQTAKPLLKVGKQPVFNATCRQPVLLRLRPMLIFVSLLLSVVVAFASADCPPPRYGGSGGSGFHFDGRCTSFADIAAKYTHEHASCAASLKPVVTLRHTNDDWCNIFIDSTCLHYFDNNGASSSVFSSDTMKRIKRTLASPFILQHQFEHDIIELVQLIDNACSI